MNQDELRALLSEVQSGQRSVDTALQDLKDFPVAEIESASLDTHRQLRRGFPEVVFAEGKDPNHILEITGKLLENEQNILLTRVAPTVAKQLLDTYPETNGEYNSVSRTLVFRSKPIPIVGRGTILVVTAGTADIGVADEALLTAELMGNTVERIVDVGVAGLHRLLRHRDQLLSAEVLIVVAGMEGALPSVVCGLVNKPVIAVPTSIGYGASFKGLTALLGMLNSCAAGITVVNIDNGFGAGYAAALMNRTNESSP